MIYDKDYIRSRCEVDPITGCWNWKHSKDTAGYASCNIDKKTRKVSRLAYELWNAPPGKLHVLHKCDNTVCVNPEHLFLGTHTDNMRDASNKGRLKPVLGSAHPSAKLTDADVVAIRASTKTQGLLASEFGVSQVTISMIRLRKKWRHIPATP